MLVSVYGDRLSVRSDSYLGDMYKLEISPRTNTDKEPSFGEIQKKNYLTEMRLRRRSEGLCGGTQVVMGLFL